MESDSGLGAVGSRDPSSPRMECVWVVYPLGGSQHEVPLRALWATCPGEQSQARPAGPADGLPYASPSWANLTFATWAGLRHYQPWSAARASLASHPWSRRL